METLLASPGLHKRSHINAEGCPRGPRLVHCRAEPGRRAGSRDHPPKRVSQGRKLGLEARAAQRWEEVRPPGKGLWQAGPLFASPGTADPAKRVIKSAHRQAQGIWGPSADLSGRWL